MSKSKKRIDRNQVIFDFDTPIDAYTRLRNEIINAPAPIHCGESYAESCIEIAAVLKVTISETGKSREEIVDAINKYFGWQTKDKRKCLTLSMFNNYLSKPVQYPIPAVGIKAIQHICRSLRPIGYLAEIEGGKVITRDEVRELGMGKLDNAIKEMQRLKKELMGGKRR